MASVPPVCPQGVCTVTLGLLLLVLLAAGTALALPVVRPTDPPSLAVAVVERDRLTRLPIAPPPLVSVRGQAVVIGDDAPNQWAAGTRLPALVNPTGSVMVGAVRPGSVAVRAAPGGEPYRVNDDYLLDERWAAIGRVATGRIPPGATVYLDYDYYRSRLDTVQLPAAGVPSVRRGQAVLSCPHPAGAAPGHQVRANVWVRPGVSAITAADIYPVGPASTFPAPDGAGTQGTRRLLESGAQVTMVALGDSVTCGGEASKPELAFPELLASALRERYPRAQVRLVNAGVGGTNSDYALERLDRDVLAARPQLVVIEFINDFGWPPAKIKENYRQLVGRLRAAGAEVVILTPHLIWPEWMGSFQVAYRALVEVAAELGVGLADGSARWAALRQVGIPYETLLVNCINHPDDRGHRLFLEALLPLF